MRKKFGGKHEFKEIITETPDESMTTASLEYIPVEDAIHD